jgi:alkylation response protein AidB-like acyl-CoA dehydrogenase
MSKLTIVDRDGTTDAASAPQPRDPIAAPAVADAIAVDSALAAIAQGAAARDAAPAFPYDAFESLRSAGLLALTLPLAEGSRAVGHAAEWDAVRRVARADSSVGRIYDGHLNAVERLAFGLHEPLRSQELDAVAAGTLLLGVWGADPGPGEGPPAALEDGGTRVSGVKTFCSGAGGIDRALVLVRGGQGEPGPPYLAYVDLSDDVEVDRAWFRGTGMRASESHRVVFHGAPVLQVLGGAGEIAREPYFGRDALRTAAMWAGVADTAAADALAQLRARTPIGDLDALAAGRIAAALATIDALLAAAGAHAGHQTREALSAASHAAHADAAPGASQLDESITVRAQIAAAARTILDEGMRAGGSRPLATGSAFDRARRDLELFLLQHRLDPLVAKLGRRLLDARS